MNYYDENLEYFVGDMDKFNKKKSKNRRKLEHKNDGKIMQKNDGKIMQKNDCKIMQKNDGKIMQKNVAKNKHKSRKKLAINNINLYDKLLECDNIVLCGGGIRCIALCGAIDFLSENGMLNNIKRIVGTSAGAIVGLMLNLGYTCDEINEELELLDNDRIFGSGAISFLNFPKIIYNLINHLGLNNGENFANEIEKLLTNKGYDKNITFKELYKDTGIELCVIATDIYARECTTFCKSKTPKVKIIDGIRATSCIPLLFYPVEIDGKLYIDGGIYDNFPLSQTSGKTIGINIHVIDNNEISDSGDIGFFKYMGMLMDMIIVDAGHKSQRKIGDLYNINGNAIVFNVSVPKVNIVNFDLPIQEKQKIRHRGYNDIANIICDDGIL